MRRSILRPGGALIGTPGIKLKILEFLPRSPAKGNFGTAWGLYSEPDFDARMAFAVACGANCVKIGMPSVRTATDPGAAAMQRGIQSFCGLLRKYKLRVYLNIGGGIDFLGSDGSGFNYFVPTMMQYLSYWTQYGLDLIVGGDICNEVQFYVPPTWGATSGNSLLNLTYTTRMANDLAALLAQAKATVPGTPWSFSVYHNSAASMTNDLMKLQSLIGCDFHDYHPYNGLNGPIFQPDNANMPKASDLAALEATSWFIGTSLFGECGVTDQQSPASVRAFINGLSAQAARPRSAGGVIFGDIDYQDPAGNNYAYGITGRAAQTQAFTYWPASPL